VEHCNDGLQITISQWWFADYYIKFYLNTQHASCILNAPYPHRHFAQSAITAICFCLKRIFLKVLCMTEFHQTRSFTGHLPSIDGILTFFTSVTWDKTKQLDTPASMFQMNLL
jgi:hypothetical protein